MSNMVFRYQRVSNVKQAFDSLKRLLRQLFTVNSVYSLTGWFYEITKQEDKALHYYEKAVNTSSHRGDLYFRIAHLQYRKGLVKEAGESFRKAADSGINEAPVFWVETREVKDVPDVIDPSAINHQLLDRPNSV